MILGLLGGVVVLLVLFVLTAATAYAIIFWPISIPLFILWFRWMIKREQKRQLNYKLYASPEQKARDARSLARIHADNEYMSRVRAREKGKYPR
jgi:hypothetical protein